MTPKEIREGRLHALYKKWGLASQKKEKIQRKAGQTSDHDLRSPSMIQKMTEWFGQIVGLEKQEKEIIGEIDEIEKKHKSLRDKKKLRRIAPQKEEAVPDDEERNPKDRLWMWLLMFWLFFPKKKKKPETPQNG